MVAEVNRIAHACAAVLIAASAPCHAASTTSDTARQVSQYGITWTFDRPREVGRFVTGDWWVVGPVRIASVTPTPGPAPEGQRIAVKKNQFGDTAHRDDNGMRNGSMVIATLTGSQGFDSRAKNYDAGRSVSFPRVLKPGESLVSSISHTKIPNLAMHHEIMWPSEKKTNSVLKAAAILTCLGREPPDDAFRPPYAGTPVKLHRVADLAWDRLAHLRPVGNPLPWEQMERYFQRPWLDFTHSWIDGAWVPSDNQPSYGREYARLASIASLMLQLDVPRNRKRKLLIGLVQRGIDLWGVTKLGRHWDADGGIWSGRKWPIVFAGIMLGEAEMQRPHPTYRFHEDQQTYYGKSWFGATALYQMCTHHGPRRPYEERPPEEWDAMDRRSEGYRVSSTAQGWIGSALAALIMRAKRAYNHDAFFDYCDRWMSRDDPYAAARGSHKRPRQEGKTYDDWVDAMWRAYRDKIPPQPGATTNLKWIVKGRKWEANPNPAAPPTQVADVTDERDDARPSRPARRKPLPGAVDLVDAQQRTRAAEALAGGEAITVFVSSARQSMKISRMREDGTLLLLGSGGLNMNMAWERLSLVDRRALATKLRRDGNEDDAFVIAFYALAAGDHRGADESLRACPSRVEDIDALFEAAAE